MKSKPSWGLWLTWVIGYSGLDMVLAALWHGGFAWDQVRGAVEGALFAGTVTWLFALYKWHKADCGL
jgi:hypothetical protein